MIEKRFFLIRKFLQKDKFHDIICHRFMDSKETEKTLNRLHGKYLLLKMENEQLKLRIKELEEENLSNKIPTKYYEVWFYQENGFASTNYRVKSFLKKENAKACAKKMNKENDDIYDVYEKKFADGDIND